jgi:hypothetical protein
MITWGEPFQIKLDFESSRTDDFRESPGNRCARASVT